MTQKKQNKAINAQGYTEFKIYSEIHGKITRFGLEIYDWAFFIFLTTLCVSRLTCGYPPDLPHAQVFCVQLYQGYPATVPRFLQFFRHHLEENSGVES